MQPSAEGKRRMLAAWDTSPDSMAFLRSCAQASTQAQLHPLPPRGRRTAACSAYANYLSFVGHLAAIEHPMPFPLPRQKLAALFDLLPSTVGVLTEWAVREGLLSVVRKGGAKPWLYQFNFEKYPALKERL